MSDSAGTIGLTAGAIAIIAGRAAADCYGVVGLASRRPIDGIARVLHLTQVARGVEVRLVGNDVSIDLYVIVEYGTRISEVARNVQRQVKFAVERSSGNRVTEVNVNVQDLHVSPERTNRH